MQVIAKLGLFHGKKIDKAKIDLNQGIFFR